MARKKLGFGTGKRKTAIAKARVKAGYGKVTVNSINLEAIRPILAREIIREPLVVLGDEAKNLDIKVNVSGGGIMGQAQAARLAIARAIVDYFGTKKIKKLFMKYDRSMLIADVRKTEPQKPYRSAARRQRQTSKR